MTLGSQDQNIGLHYENVVIRNSTEGWNFHRQ